MPIETIEIPKLTSDDISRFFSKINRSPGQGPNGDCWERTGAGDKNGYGRLAVGGKLRKAHRVAYIVFNGPIPPGMHVLHTCDNPPCVNPAHLWVGTNADNMKDRDAKGRNNAARGKANGTHTMPDRRARGEQNGSTKLTEDQVVEIRKQHAGGRSLLKLGADYGVSGSTIYDAANRITWKHVV